MAKITTYPDGSPALATDEMVVARAGANKRLPLSVINEFQGIYAELQLSATQSIANASYDPISWTTEVADTGGLFAVGTPTYVTIPTTGWYRVKVHVAFAANATGLREVSVQRNTGSPHQTLAFDSRNAVNGSSTGTSLFVTAYLTAGTKIYVYVWQNSGGALNLATYGSRGSYTTLIVSKV